MPVCKFCMKWDWSGPDSTSIEPNNTGHVQHPLFLTPNVLQIRGNPRPNSRIPTNYYFMDDSLVGQGSRARNRWSHRASTNTNMGGLRHTTVVEWKKNVSRNTVRITPHTNSETPLYMRHHVSKEIKQSKQSVWDYHRRGGKKILVRDSTEIFWIWAHFGVQRLRREQKKRTLEEGSRRIV